MLRNGPVFASEFCTTSLTCSFSGLYCRHNLKALMRFSPGGYVLTYQDHAVKFCGSAVRISSNILCASGILPCFINAMGCSKRVVVMFSPVLMVIVPC